MNVRDVAAMVLKILALYLLFEFLTMLPMGFDFFEKIRSIQAQTGPEYDAYKRAISWSILNMGLTILSYLGLAICLFVGAGRLSRFFVAAPEDKVSLSGAVSNDVVTLTFQCFGVYAVIKWFPELVQTICRTAIYSTWQVDQVPFLRRFYDNGSILIGPTIGSIVGLLLIFKAKGLLRLIYLSRPMSRE